MFWQKPLLLLGILAAVGNTAPLAPFSENVPASLLKRAIDDPSAEGLVFRADTRTPDQIKKAGGFTSKANFKGVTKDVSLFNHCNGATDSFMSKDNDGYVSTSVAFDVCQSWVEDYLNGEGVIYQIATFENLIDCAMTLKQYDPHPEEQELAALDGIPWKQIVGWWDQFTMSNGNIVDGKFTENPDFDKAKYDSHDDAGAQYQLAGFPKDHKAWKEAPWNAYTACTDKTIKPNTARSVNDVFARARSSKSTKSKATKSKASKSKTTNTKTTHTKNTNTKNTKSKHITPKKCTAAQKKAGTCKTTQAATCTAAQEKAGKCKKTCTAAEKKAGKCEVKKQGTCGPIKTNKEFYDEYVKALRAGSPPKSGATKTKGAKKAPAGKKTGSA